MEQKTMQVGNISQEIQEEDMILKGRIISYVDNFFPTFEKGCITAVKKMANKQNLLVHINLNQRTMSFEAIGVNNQSSYSPLFIPDELEDSFLKEVEIRKTKDFKEQIIIIKESLNLAYPILRIIDDLFY